MKFSTASTVAALAAVGSATYNGFNYGSTDSSGTPYDQSGFESLFKEAQSVSGLSPTFNSARLYTMIQGGTTNTPISAIQAAIDTKTNLLLGLWCSGGNFDNEIAALKSAISTYGSELGDLVVGISVGSEDLYRDSEMGIQSNAGVGIGPDTLLSYIKEVKSTISGTVLSGAKIGHVDTWTSWVNGTSTEVIDALDWIGFDGYPYFQNTMANSIDDALTLFDESWQKTVGAAGSKEVWLTETGWPVSGPEENQAVASTANAKTYWDEVFCKMVGTVNLFWYTLYDGNSSPSFSIVDSKGAPLFNLTCSATSSSSSSSAAASSTSSSAASSSASSVAASSTVASSTVEASSSAAASSVETSAAASSSAAAVTSTAATSTAAATTSAAASTSTEASVVAASSSTSTSALVQTGGATFVGYSFTAAVIALLSFVM